MPSVFASLKVVVGGDVTAFEKAMKRAERRLDQMGSRWQALGSKLTIGVTAPLAAMGGAAIKAAVDFESSFAGVRKTVNATEGEFAKLSKGFREMAKTIPVNVNELNKIGEAAGQLGIKKENILDFTKTIAALGVTTNLTTDQAATALARFANITQMPQERMSNLGSTIVALGNNFATTEAEITEFGLRIAGAGKTIGLSEPQILGFGAALSSVGINAEAGGTAISKVFIELAASINKGGKDLHNFAAVAGMTGTQFKKAFQEDAAGAVASFIEGLGRVQKSGGDTFGVLEKLGFTEARLRDALLRSAGAGDLLRNALELGSKAFTENNALTKEAAERYKTTASQFVLLKNNAQDVAITFGQALLPVVNDLLRNLKPMAGVLGELGAKFAQLPSPIRTTTVSLLALAALAGPLLYLAGVIAKVASAVFGLARMVGLSATKFSLLAGGIAVIQGVITATDRLSGVTTSTTQRMVAGLPVISQMVKAWEQLRNGLAGAREEWERIKHPIEWFTGRMPSVAAAARKAGSDIHLGLDGSVQALADHLSGTGLTDGLRRLEVAFQSLTAEQRKSPDVMKRVGEQALALKAAGAKLTPELAALAENFRKSTAAGNAFSPALLTGKDRAEALAEQLKTLRDRILGVPMVEEARLWATALQEPGQAAQVLADQGLRNELGSALDLIVRKFGSLKAKGLESLGALHDSIKALAQSPQMILPGLAPLGAQTVASTSAGPQMIVPFSTSLSPGAGKDQKSFLSSAFGSTEDFGKALSGTVMSALTGGGGVIKSIGGLLGGGIGSQLAKSLTGGVGIAIKGFAGGALNAILPGIGALAGPLLEKGLGAIGKLFGFGSKKKKEAKETDASRSQFLEQIGGMEKLKQMAESVDFSLSKMLSTKKPQEFKAEVEKLNAALEQKKEKWEGLQRAVEGVNARTAALLGPLRSASAEFERLKGDDDATSDQLSAALARMQSAASDAQPAFERLGQFATAAFAGMIRQGATAMEAFAALSPTFDGLAEGVNQFGLQGTDAINRLLGMRELVTTYQAQFDALAANTQMLQGFGQAGILTRDLFQSLGADVAAQLQAIADKGGDVSQAMALSQPVLQQLWEGQQKYGAFTDEATAALLKQAEEQGLVGAHMKGVNEKILDVLLAIGDALGAKIPDALKNLPSAAEESARGIEDALGDIRVPPIKVPYYTSREGGEGLPGGGEHLPGGEVVPFARGGIVRRPTIGLIGEAGPEAVVPLRQLEGVASRRGGLLPVTIQIAGGRTLWDGLIEVASAEGLS